MIDVTGDIDGSPPTARRGSLRLGDLGMLPLLLAIPFMYYPKVLEGDTQPWVLFTALLALCTYRTDKFLRKSDWPILALAALCVLVYVLRSRSDYGSVRAAFTQLQFVVLWIVGRREGGDAFGIAIRLTIVLWLAFGLVQFVGVSLGLEIPVIGRYVEGRSGVPSLTAEASYYGSLSILQMMYLLAERRPANRPYILASGLSVLLSGSLLAILMLALPLMKLQMRARIMAVLGVGALGGLLTVVRGFGGVSARLSGFNFGDSAAGLLIDASLNLRVGHIYFTLFHNLAASLIYQSPVDFMNQYNQFANSSLLFIETGSDFILPAAGDIIYGAGILGAILLITFIWKAAALAPTRFGRIEKIIVIFVCMLSPIGLSNPFLIVYAQKKDEPA